MISMLPYKMLLSRFELEKENKSLTVKLNIKLSIFNSFK